MKAAPPKLIIATQVDPRDRDLATWISENPELQDAGVSSISRVEVERAWGTAPGLTQEGLQSLYRLSESLGARIPAVWEPDTAEGVFASPPTSQGKPLRRTRIICTVGPACADVDTLADMIEAGMDVARLNFSHIRDDASAQRWMGLLSAAMEKAGRTITVLADLQGPKIRVGALAEPINARAGDEFVLRAEDESGAAESNVSESGFIPVAPPEVLQDLKPGHRIRVHDGEPELIVLPAENGSILVRAVTDGVIDARKGLNMPDTAISMLVPTDYDHETIARINRLEIDGKPFVNTVAVSFIENAAQIRQYRAAFGRPISIVAKIERKRAVEEGVLEEIMAETDAAMAARGDYGAEAGIEHVPMMQDDVHEVGNRAGKPTVNATETMTGSADGGPPSRSNATDVATAIEKGAEGIMTSGETAVSNGQDPVAVVGWLHKLILAKERAIRTGAGRR